MYLINIIDDIKKDFDIISKNSKNEINNIVLNSKLSDNTSIFTAIKGFKTDGHIFLNECYNNGCRDFVVENVKRINEEWKKDSTIISVKDSRQALAIISNYIFDFPFNKLKMIGITGTKGKTTVAYLIYHLIAGKASLFSTIEYVIGSQRYDSQKTTMEACELQKLLKNSAENKDKYAVVEVSSHAVTLKRIFGINWDIAIFTSFSRDHLDLYGTMDNYFQAKLDFFKNLNSSPKKDKAAVINIDDPKGLKICRIFNKKVNLITVGRKKNALYRVVDSVIRDNFTEIIINNKNKEYKFKTQLKGSFNTANAALAIAAVMELGISVDVIQKRLEEIKYIEGRFEIIIENPFKVIIDFAHTPDSLRNILAEAGKLSENKVILVFGCTGERDKEKRSIMGEIAGEYADFSIITNDDTYNEDENEISRQVEKGFINTDKKSQIDYVIILDRKKAIEKALISAVKGDVIVIAGMGHQKIQHLKSGPIDYNDKEAALEIFNKIRES